MIVKVTQEHIDKGKNRNVAKDIFASCPIALALIDTFKVESTWVSYTKLSVGQFPENLIFEIETPMEIRNWMIEFDQGMPVEPFEFELSLEGVRL